MNARTVRLDDHTEDVASRDPGAIRTLELQASSGAEASTEGLWSARFVQMPYCIDDDFAGGDRNGAGPGRVMADSVEAEARARVRTELGSASQIVAPDRRHDNAGGSAICRTRQRRGARDWCDVRSGAAVTAVCVSADGATLITAGADGTVRVWDIATGNEAPEVCSLDGHGVVRSMAVTPDGHTLATASGDGPARIWDLLL